jgi:hypothetical protein
LARIEEQLERAVEDAQPEQRAVYRRAHHEAVLGALTEYAPDAVVVLDVDIGYTDPQLIAPHGGGFTVDGPAQRIIVEY